MIWDCFIRTDNFFKHIKWRLMIGSECFIFFYWLTWCCPNKLGGNPNWLGHPVNPLKAHLTNLIQVAMNCEKGPTFLKPWLMYIGNWIWDFLRGIFDHHPVQWKRGNKKRQSFLRGTFWHFLSLYCYWTSVTWPDIWHTGNQFSLVRCCCCYCLV